MPGGLDLEREGKRPLRELGRAVSRPHDFVEPLPPLRGEHERSAFASAPAGGLRYEPVALRLTP